MCRSIGRSRGVIESGPPIMTGGPPPIGVTASDRGCRIYAWNSEPGALLCRFNRRGRASSTSTVGRSEVARGVGKTGRWIDQVRAPGMSTAFPVPCLHISLRLVRVQVLCGVQRDSIASCLVNRGASRRVIVTPHKTP